ncbi:MAG TPA: nuclear transport factor 2 family protein [Stellaceae bacterium]|jgi:hypothetical protein|nr:nuclear transport factor 2 family protein [Stellaceae bacterium]
MQESDDRDLFYAMERLINSYWVDVDHNRGLNAHEFYTSDAVYSVGNNRFEGRNQIQAFYTRRRERGHSTTRHLLNQLQVSCDGARQGRIAGVMTLYRADGSPPFSGTPLPAMIADFDIRCALGSDQRWYFASHEVKPIFLGRDLPISITTDPARL